MLVLDTALGCWTSNQLHLDHSFSIFPKGFYDNFSLIFGGYSWLKLPTDIFPVSVSGKPRAILGKAASKLFSERFTRRSSAACDSKISRITNLLDFFGWKSKVKKITYLVPNYEASTFQIMYFVVKDHQLFGEM